MAKVLALGALGALAALVALLAVFPAPTAAVPSKAGYVWNENPSSTLGQVYRPDIRWNWNSEETESRRGNKVRRTATGRYDVRFLFLGTGNFRGTFAISAYGPDPVQCKAVDWMFLGPAYDRGVRLRVSCWDAAGGPRNARFTAMYTNSDGRQGVWAHVFANQLSLPSYTPTYQAGPAGPKARVSRIGPGRYNVTFPAITSGAVGTVQVTAVGSDAVACKPVSWGGVPLVAQVHCRNPRFHNALADSAFQLAYAHRQELSAYAAHAAAYASANEPATGFYPPAAPFQWQSTTGVASTTVSRVGVGRYRWATGLVAGTSPGSVVGVPFVSALGPEQHRCQLFAWSPSGFVDVWCFTANGAPIDTKFVVQFVR
ncbi:hypothetical protein DFJ74DRAFT_718728 [Hyaloraphidium curvatum]|nr:hypothetical protein DFJ74DRAFT_718728 [Hyaloraphidium curvatum]